MRNLEHTPYVDINVVDVFRRRGYRFRGRAEISDDPALIAFLREGLGALALALPEPREAGGGAMAIIVVGQ
jgi:hypothetical protein